MFRTSVDYAIIDVVAHQKDLSVQELHQQICNKGISVSLPNFYKIVAHMVDNQILIRPHGKIQIHSIFARYMAGLLAGIEKAMNDENPDSIQQLEIGQQHTWTESNLYELNITRMDLLGRLVKMHAGSVSYHYASHPYFLLCTPEKEQLTMEEICGDLEKSFILYGNSTFLDRYASQLLPGELFTALCTEGTPFPEEGYIADIIGSYIVECMFPKAISDHFALFFQTIIGLEGYKKELFCQIIKMKAPCTLKLIYSPEHAEKMKMKISKHLSS